MALPDLSILPTFLDALRVRRQITFVLADDLGELHGLADLETAIVFLDRRNTTGEMRATLTHELLHLTDPNCDEDEVEQMAAELLIPLPDALAARASGNLAEHAERLAVDVSLLRTRIRAIGDDHAVADGVG